MSLGPMNDHLVSCSCLLCRLDIWASSDGEESGGRPQFFDVVGLGSGYKLLVHDCDNPDLDAMWREIGLTPGLIRPAKVRPEPPESKD